MDYDGVALSLLVQCPVPVESNACLPVFYSVVPTQEIYRNTYIASQIVGHNAPESHQVNGVLPPL